MKSKSLAYSMTGYGQAEVKTEQLTVSIEIKSVNSRYLDLNLKYPSEYNYLDLEFRNHLKKILKRGRIDLQIKKSHTSSNESTDINLDLFKNYWESIFGVYKNMKIDPANLDTSAITTFILNQNNVFIKNETNTISPEEQNLILACLSSALDKLLESRKVEGQALVDTLVSHLERLDQIWKEIEKEKSSLVSNLSKELVQKLKSLFQQLDFTSERIEQEAAWRAERSDISEEMNRITYHLESLRKELTEPSGKKIEFLAQELGREFNTIGSKISSAEIQNYVVLAKLEIEKIREQSFNIE